MKEFTAAEVKRHTGDVWKEVSNVGIAKIKHRDRNDMVILELSEWKAMVSERDYYKGLVKDMAAGEY